MTKQITRIIRIFVTNYSTIWKTALLTLLAFLPTPAPSNTTNFHGKVVTFPETCAQFYFNFVESLVPITMDELVTTNNEREN